MYFIDVLFVAFGIYMLILDVRMKNEQSIPNFLISSKVNLERVKNKEGYIKYMYPRIAVFGILTIIISTVLFLDNFLSIPTYISWLAYLIYFAVVVYYCIISVKAQNRFLFKGEQ